MCMKIREISGLSPQEIHLKYCENPNQNLKGCVTVTELLDKIGISYKSANLCKLEQKLHLKNDSIIGLAYSQGDNLKILYSDTLNEYEINYVLAHELGHCCMHLPVTTKFHVEMKTKQDYYFLENKNIFSLIKCSSKKIKKEISADNFAAELLIPTDSLNAFLNSTSNISKKQISDFFKVPIPLVEKKILLCEVHK